MKLRTLMLLVILPMLVSVLFSGSAEPGQAQVPSSWRLADAAIANLPLRITCNVNAIDPVSSLHNRSSSAVASYQPKQTIALAHQTNFGARYAEDIYGRPALNDPIVVLHETVGSASGTIAYFQTPHPRDEDQASYHSLITLNGTIVYLVPPEKRAFGAGNSVFVGPNGAEAVQTNPKFAASVNNFAYHISLETPPSGIHNGRTHQGYTAAQYQSLAWLVAQTGVPDSRITTHQAVDRSGSRIDPRSFSFSRFKQLLNQYPRQDEIGLGCLRQLALQTLTQPR